MTNTDIIIEVAKLDKWSLAQDGMTLVKQSTNKAITVKHALIQDMLDYYITSRDVIIPMIEKHWNNNSDFAKNFIGALYSEHTHPDCDEIGLSDAFGKDSHSITLALLLSTPKQLCIALLKATGKWKD